MLEAHAEDADVQHAAVSLLQVLTTVDAANVMAVNQANVLPRLVHILFMKGHRYDSLSHESAHVDSQGS